MTLLPWQLGSQSFREGLLWKGIWSVERSINRGHWEGKGPGNGGNMIFSEDVFGVCMLGMEPQNTKHSLFY